jgi:hypothetical protein
MAPIDAPSFDFPHPVLTKIGDNNTEPTFASILVAHVELNANAASIYSACGDGLQGHPSLTIDANDYIEHSIGNKPFDPPTAPPAAPVHLTTASDALIVETNRQHKLQKEEFILFLNADTALRNLLIAAVPPIFLADQRDPMTGFDNKTLLQLLTYLHTTFGNISEKELEQNTARMQLQWNPPTAIEALFLQLENGVAFTTSGQDTPTKRTTLYWAYIIIEKTGRFDIACREWRHMDPNTKDWPLFKRHFKAAYKDLRRLDTAGTAGYSSRPCRQQNGPSKSPHPSVPVVRIHRRVSCQHLHHQAHDVCRTPPRLLLDPRPHHKQQSHQCHMQPPGRGTPCHCDRHERDGWKYRKFHPTLPATSAVNQRDGRTQGTG